MKQDLSYCGQVVREQDRDRFLLSMFAPPDRREALWALFAFNHEIAKTREVVSEMQLGLIRLQWWREAIGAIYDLGVIPDHEVVKALAAAVETYKLPREHFETLIYAREFDLEDVLPGNLEGLLNYADFTATPLMKLAVRIAGGDEDAEPVQPVAVNYALAGILRAVPFHASQRRCYLPDDLMKQNVVRIESGLYEGKKQDGLRDVVKAVAAQIVPGVKPELDFLKAAQKLSLIYAGQIRRARYDVFSPKLRIPPVLRELRVVLGVKAA